MKRMYSKALIFLLLTALALTACSGKPGSDASGGTPAAEKVLTIAHASDIKGFDFQNNNITLTSAVLVNVFDSLVKKDANANYQIAPLLAASWEQKDPLTWRFVLRKDVKFHNGDPFTSADVKYSLERVMGDTKLIANSTFKNLNAIQIVDDYTVDITTKEPDPILLNRLSGNTASIFPSKYIKDQGFDAFLKNPVGTGPYQYSKWLKDDRVELVKNKSYYGGEPKWDKVVFRTIPEDSTRAAELLTGGVDIAVNIAPGDVDRVEKNDKTHAVLAPIQRVIQMWFKTQGDGPTANPKVREAIELAVNNKEIADKIMGGSAIPTKTQVTPGNFGADNSLFDKFAYDPQKAKALLQEAGYGDGLKINISANNMFKEVAEAVAGMLDAVGIKANVDLLEQNKFAEKLNSKTLNEVSLLGWGNSDFDGSVLDQYQIERAKGITDYNNAEVDKLLKNAAKNMNAKEREQQYQAVQQQIVKDRPAVYLFQLKGRYGVSDKIDYKPRLDELYVADEISLKAGK
ncbi:ABC transporter substrate-binding protein [Paenibacillus hodogayensis]|uniref:ABC transporter substrate-binding protein n=1 Tax=Paenibacillus hodogayensis TaxID=279208 RepID=A0ABV5W6M7_9BACL